MRPGLVRRFIINGRLPDPRPVRPALLTGQVTKGPLAPEHRAHHIRAAQPRDLLLTRRRALAQPRVHVAEADAQLPVSAHHVGDAAAQVLAFSQTAHELEVRRHPRPALGQLVALEVGRGCPAG